MRSLITVAAAMTLFAAPLVAQGHTGHEAPQPPRQGGMMGGGMQMGGGDGPMGPLTAQFGKYAPDAVLAMKEHLSLTAEQETRLNALVEEGRKAESDAHAPAHAAHMALNRILAAEPLDAEAARAQFIAHHTAEGNVQWIRASMAMQAKALLTPAQRTHVEQMGGGGMRH